MSKAALVAVTGFRFADRDVVRFSWGELSFRWGIGLSLIHSDEQWMLHLWPLFLNLYIYLGPSRSQPKDQMQDSWGFVWFLGSEMSRSIHFHWGEHTHILNLPWDWKWVRTSRLLMDGTWEHETPANLRPFGARDELNVWSKTVPYDYTLRNGEVQHRLATVKVDEREWRWRLGVASPRRVRRAIDVRFDGEVGEETGSWKGGCIGCGYDLRPDEDPIDCLRRMEREREF